MNARVVMMLTVACAGAVGWFAGAQTGADTAAAADQGARDGRLVGSVEGRRDGRAEGHAKGVASSQAASHAKAFKTAFARAHAVAYKRAFDTARAAEEARQRAIADPNGDGSGCPLYHARPYGNPSGPCIPPAHPPSNELRPWEHCPEGWYPVGVTGACAPY